MQKVTKIDLPKILDNRGNLSFFEDNNPIPFKIKRVYWIYDVPGGEMRGSHAFKDSQEVIIALAGSFDVVVNDGKEEKVYTLNRSYYCLYVPKMTWRYLNNFSTNSLAFIASDTNYDDNQYIYDFDKYKKLINEENE